MSKTSVEMYGYTIEVEYDYTAPEKGSKRTPSIEECVDIYDYSLESDEVADEFGLYDDRSRQIFENELAQIIIEHERAKNIKKYGKFIF